MKLDVIYLKTEQLQTYENNVKRHPAEQIEEIKKSIQEFGFNDPIGVYGDNNIIVEGHGRYIAAIELGITEVPVIRLDYLTDEERRAYALVHNQLTLNSGFDYDVLMMELDNIKNYNMAEFRFEDVEDYKSFDAESYYEDSQDDKVEVVCDSCGAVFYINKKGEVVV